MADLAGAVGYAPHHFQRVFHASDGVSPAAYGRAVRAGRAAASLDAGAGVTEAIHAAGYGAASRFYADGAARLGMAPRARAKGAAGLTIRWTVVANQPGAIAGRGDGHGPVPDRVRRGCGRADGAFPQATIVPGDAALATLAAEVVALVEAPGRDAGLPVDVQGTAFQEAVWQALRTIPAGETRSYAELAAAAGRPGATRAAGTACGRNPSGSAGAVPPGDARDGAMGGYAWAWSASVRCWRVSGGSGA